MYTKANFNARAVSRIGMLIALEVVIARFCTIRISTTYKISLSFVPIVIAAMLYGVVAAGLVGAIGDIIGAVLFPAGPFFPGFTLTAFLSGIVFGLFLKKGKGIVPIVISVFIVQILLNLCLNTYWISFLSGSSYLALLSTRVYQAVFMSAVQIAGTLLIQKKILPILKRFE